MLLIFSSVLRLTDRQSWKLLPQYFNLVPKHEQVISDFVKLMRTVCQWLACDWIL